MPKTSQSPPSALPPDANADVAALGYEEARDELVAVVARLEAGAASLEDSLALWERGEALATRCQAWLDGARERLSAVRDFPVTSTPATSTPVTSTPVTSTPVTSTVGKDDEETR